MTYTQNQSFIVIFVMNCKVTYINVLFFHIRLIFKIKMTYIKGIHINNKF